MIFTEQHLQMLIGWACWRAAKSLGIIENDEFPPSDAVAMISQVEGHRAALQAFVDAYIDWYRFHVQVFTAGESGGLSAKQSANLVQLTDRRNAARQALIDITSD